MMTVAAEIVIERLLDRAVARAMADSPRAAALIARLQGRRLAIQISGTPWTTVVESTGRTLKTYRALDAHARIVGAPLSLLALAGADSQAVIRRGDVRIEGDAEIAQQFGELGLLLRPDLEAGLSQVLGRSGAHIAMRGMRAAVDWTRAAAWTSLRNVAEYLAHESGDLVSRPEAEHFLRGVERLREQLDRIDARLQLMERRAGVLAAGPKPP
ncbi:MAG: SCP2 sterol-binding domain-containing protein [Steroidobacteraceae bacterium]|jgi:ubiquinone biosynthesis accessory factor UbiJ